jgi:hypothetical protein
VLRVSDARASLNARTSAKASPGAKPRAARLEPPTPAAQILKNCLRVTCILSLLREALNKLIPLMVRQAHHERNQPLPFVLSLSKDLFSASLASFMGFYGLQSAA